MFNCNTGKQFEHCELDLPYISADGNGLASNKHFITGVIKIQLGVEFEKLMTSQEKRACKCLLKLGVEDDSDSDSDDDDIVNFGDSARKDTKRKVSELVDESKYIDCGSFIMGSAAIVESLWSEQDNLLANKRRRGMSPMLVECILFLKKNKDLWGIRDVNMANEDRKAGKRIERTEEKKKNEKELVDLLTELNL